MQHGLFKNARLKYLRYLCLHKLYVFWYCLLWGIPIRGLAHDLSKFTPLQWRAYLRYFHGNWMTADEVIHLRMVRPNGLEPKWNEWKVKQFFDYAWNRHQKIEAHHWQYWVLVESPLPRALEMPYKTIKHMVADWIGASRAQGNGNPVEATQSWYLDRANKMILHPRTRATVEYLLRVYTPVMYGDHVALEHYRKLEIFSREKE